MDTRSFKTFKNLCVQRKLEHLDLRLFSPFALLYSNHRLTSVLDIIVQFTVLILYVFRVFEWKWLTQLPLTTNCQNGKLPSAALNPCLIDNNYRQNPLYYRDTAQQLLSVAQSKIQDSCRGYKCTNCIPGSLAQKNPFLSVARE